MVIVTRIKTKHPSTPSSNHRHNRRNKKETKRRAWNFHSIRWKWETYTSKRRNRKIMPWMQITRYIHSQCETKYHIRGIYRIDFYLCTYNLLKTTKLCGMTGFNDIASSDHCGSYFDRPVNCRSQRKKSQPSGWHVIHSRNPTISSWKRHVHNFLSRTTGWNNRSIPTPIISHNTKNKITCIFILIPLFLTVYNRQVDKEWI